MGATVVKLAPRLPVLEDMMRAIHSVGTPNLEKIAIIGVQHMLFTTASLLDALIRLGVKPENIYLMGKNYSTCHIVTEHLCSLGVQYQRPSPQTKLGGFSGHFRSNISQLWEKFLTDLPERKFTALLILDDGACCLSEFPREISSQLPVVGVEQTTSGIKSPLINTLPFPVVEVASSAVKQHLESPMIADAVIQKLNNIFPSIDVNLTCGVVGMGVIGQAITQKLLSLGFKVITYDKHAEKNIVIGAATPVENTEEVILKAGYIFGCAGEDITKNLDLPGLKSAKKIFISCSSKDIEFHSLLRDISKFYNDSEIDVLEDVEYKNGDVYIKVVKGGFPVNLDNSGESVPEQNIQMTRALLFGGILQGIMSLPSSANGNKNNRYMLDPILQKFIVAKWLQHSDNGLYCQTLLDGFSDIEWIRSHSGGSYYPCDFITRRFSTDLISII